MVKFTSTAYNQLHNFIFQFACVEQCPDHLPHLVEDTGKEKPTMTVCADDDHPVVIERKKKNKA